MGKVTTNEKMTKLEARICCLESVVERLDTFNYLDNGYLSMKDVLMAVVQRLGYVGTYINKEGYPRVVIFEKPEKGM